MPKLRLKGIRDRILHDRRLNLTHIRSCTQTHTHRHTHTLTLRYLTSFCICQYSDGRSACASVRTTSSSSSDSVEDSLKSSSASEDRAGVPAVPGRFTCKRDRQTNGRRGRGKVERKKPMNSKENYLERKMTQTIKKSRKVRRNLGKEKRKEEERKKGRKVRKNEREGNKR